MKAILFEFFEFFAVMILWVLCLRKRSVLVTPKTQPPSSMYQACIERVSPVYLYPPVSAFGTLGHFIGYRPLDVGCWLLVVRCWLLDVGCLDPFPRTESSWFFPTRAYPLFRQMAVESKPLFHPEVLRQQVRVFNLPEGVGDWQPLAARGGTMLLALLVGRGRLFQFRPTVSAVVNEELLPAVTRSTGTNSD